MGHPYWPLFDLEVRTQRLTLRYVDDEIAVGLADLVAAGIHDPDWMPFGEPWTRGDSPQLERSALQYHWRCRADTSPESWTINFGVIVDDVLVGSTGLMASDFARMRQFETGSWLGREFQGQGIGKEMRLATIAVGFAGLGAEWALTGAWHDNGPSLGVTRSLGYTEQGHRRMLRDDAEADRMIGFEMPRAHFDEHLRRDDIELVGIDPVREQLGLAG
jgi:RimJ/RimL family protein N-acetyltransferase